MDGECMKNLMIGTNSAVEGPEVGGVDEECNDWLSNVDKARPITRHQCWFWFGGEGAYLQEVRLVSGSAV